MQYQPIYGKIDNAKNYEYRFINYGADELLK
jgi:hypothetical protein